MIVLRVSLVGGRKTVPSQSVSPLSEKTLVDMINKVVPVNLARPTTRSSTTTTTTCHTLVTHVSMNSFSSSFGAWTDSFVWQLHEVKADYSTCLMQVSCHLKRVIRSNPLSLMTKVKNANLLLSVLLLLLLLLARSKSAIAILVFDAAEK